MLMNTIFGIPANLLLIILITLSGLILAATTVSALRFPLAFRLGIRNFPRRKSQTLLIISGLALSTLIITSALGIGDTVDYSVRSEVYRALGGIDLQIGKTQPAGRTAFDFTGTGSSVPQLTESWIEEEIGVSVAGLIDGVLLDGAAAAILQTLPVVNPEGSLSEPAVEVRGLEMLGGEGLVKPAGLSELSSLQALANKSLAEALALSVGDEIWIIKGMPAPFEIAGIVPDGELAGTGPVLLMQLEAAQSLFGQPGKLSTVYISNQGDPEAGVALSDKAVEQLSKAAGSTAVTPIKQEQLETAAAGAETITNLFVTFGTFSIASGILLIFLIYSVLAAERKSELGMSRAVGLQRADLIRQFVTEGLVYNLIAAAIGAALGVAAAIVLAEGIASLLGAGLDLTPRVSLRSIVIGYTLGMVITFITVSISAVRISKINIIAAIRDLDLPVSPRLPQWTLFLRPFTVWRAALQKAGQGNVREAARLFLVAGPKAILNFWAGLAARGPLLMVNGYLLAWVGVNLAGQNGVYGMGVSIFIIGLGQLFHWLRLPARLAYSFTGLSLVLYWTLPMREVGRLAELGSNPGDFFISGMFLVGGSILLFLYNADALLNLFARVSGRAGKLLPVARVSIAYPVAAKSRTATTLAMFSLIIFTLISTATITNTFSNFLDAEAGSGGYDIMVQTNPFNPVEQDTFTSLVDELAASGEMNPPQIVAGSVFAPVQAQSPDMPGAAGYIVQGVDESFFASHRLELSGIARGYSTPEQVWAAVQSDSSLVIIDNFSTDRSGAPGYTRDETVFFIDSIRASDTVFEPVPLQITGNDGSIVEVSVIGVLRTAPNFYGAMMNLEAVKALGYNQTNRYFLRLEDSSLASSEARLLRSGFGQQGIQTSLLKEQIQESQKATRGVFYLIQGFVGLGLLIGIAALGVITIRAVVERRQQIGVLRAIGFQRDMVQKVYLMESLFIAGLGTVIGYGLGLTFSYNLYRQVAADQGLAFLPPWTSLAAIGFAIFSASLLTAWLPARATSQVVIAEALRYE
jgi:putative ABC transport system permease protein